MLKALVNEARLRLDITTLGPLLIKTGYATVIGADMAPVLTYRNRRQEVFLPGSSLKGVFRSHIEKVINSIQPRVACNPLMSPRDPGDRELYIDSCGSQFDNKDQPYSIYAGSCPSCRLFGSTAFAGRLSVQDAYLPADSVETKKLIEHRDGVAIDRLTGGAASRAKFDLDTVTADTTFTTTLQLRNFEIWQLGLLFVIIQDMEDELIGIGSGRSRGLGKVRAAISEREERTHPGGVVLSITRPVPKQPTEPDHELWGLGRWLDGKCALYGTKHDDLLTLSPPMKHTPHTIHHLRVFKGDALKTLREQCIEDFVTRIQAWPPAQRATPEIQQGR